MPDLNCHKVNATETGTETLWPNIYFDLLRLFMFLFFSQMEKLIHQMQDEKSGVPIRTVKSFMSKIPSVFTGEERADKCTVPSVK